MSVEGVESALKDDLLKKYLKDALEVHEMGLDHKAEGWELFLKAETFAIWKRKDAGPVHEIKAVVKLRASAERVFEALYDFEKRVHWDKVFRVLWQVERYSESQDLIYSVTSCPFPLSDRDSLKLRSRVVGDNGRYWFSVHKSVAHHPKIPEDPKIVRTESEGCFLVHKTDDSDKSCVLVSILQNDPKGAIPSSIVNFAAPYITRKWIKSLETYTES